MISQQTAEHEMVTVRRSSVLDVAIRQLQERQDRQVRTGADTEAGSQAGGQAPAAAPSTPRRGNATLTFSITTVVMSTRLHAMSVSPPISVD